MKGPHLGGLFTKTLKRAWLQWPLAESKRSLRRAWTQAGGATTKGYISFDIPYRRGAVRRGAMPFLVFSYIHFIHILKH